jgi:hypothetical protein
MTEQLVQPAYKEQRVPQVLLAMKEQPALQVYKEQQEQQALLDMTGRLVPLVPLE